MDPRQLFADARTQHLCALCGQREATTRDHVPAKIFLDTPYPEGLPVVPVCVQCNRGASADELYVACLIDVALCGGIAAEGLRPKVVAALLHSPRLANRFDEAEHWGHGRFGGFKYEPSRFERVLGKIGRGLMASEDSEGHVGQAVQLLWHAMEVRPGDWANDLAAPGAAQLLPEVGSRAMVRMGRTDFGSPQWTIVQPGRFSYFVDRAVDGPTVHMLFSDYIAATCTFLPDARVADAET